MKKLILLLLAGFSLNLNAQHFVSAQKLGSAQASQFSFFSSQAKYNIDFYKILYNTTDVDGTGTVASGMMCVPKGTACDSLPMISYAHGTVLRKQDVPSRNNGESLLIKVASSTGAISIAPDYLGLGDNPGLHPYLHAESEATATIDLMRAAREYLGDSMGVYFSGETFLTGYSQGGHAAMAAAKYIQDNNLMNEFELAGAAPASGPYNLSGSQARVLVSDQPYSNPGYVCYLLFGLNRVYGNIFQNYSDILKAPYDTLIPPYFDGTYDMTVVNNLLPDTLSGFLRDSVLTNFKNDSVAKNHPIWQALMAQNNYNWKPTFPLRMHYCTLDEQVNFQNTLDADSAMTAQGATNVQAINNGPLNHGGCVTPSFQGILGFYLNTTDNCTIGLESYRFASNISVYPNPASGYFEVVGFEQTIQLKVINTSGQVVMQRELSSQQAVSTSGWPSGMYTLEITQGGKRAYQKLVVR